MQWLIDSGASVESWDEIHGERPIHAATRIGDVTALI